MNWVRSGVILGVVIMNAATTSEATAQAAKPVAFGKTSDGMAIELYTLKNDHGMIAKVMTLGATLVELHVPDRDKKSANVVLGFDDVAGYQSDANQYFGCTTGRVCNRIAKGKFSLGGKDYQLAINNDPNHLHGGAKRSLDKVVWTAKDVSDRNSEAIQFTYTSPAGEEGYPGKLKVEVTYSVSAISNTLYISYKATTDAATPVNLTNHSYFNLGGAGAATVLDHELMVNAEEYTPVDETLIPTGKVEPVAGTAVDFRKMTRLGARIDDLVKTATIGYDHNLVLNKKRAALADEAAKLREPKSGRVMSVFTTEPAIQIYTGNFLKGQKGKDGKTYAQRSAICLETQHYPDAINQKSFPSIVLEPGREYRQMTIYAFGTEK